MTTFEIQYNEADASWDLTEDGEFDSQHATKAQAEKEAKRLTLSYLQDELGEAAYKCKDIEALKRALEILKG